MDDADMRADRMREALKQALVGLQTYLTIVAGSPCAVALVVQTPQEGCVHIVGNVQLAGVAELLAMAKADVDLEILKTAPGVGPVQ